VKVVPIVQTASVVNSFVSNERHEEEELATVSRFVTARRCSRAKG
jgi:hypothetical protein